MDWSAYVEAILFVVASAIGAIVWNVRLEGKVSFLGRENANLKERLDRVEERQSLIESDIAKELKQVQVELAQIKGFLMRKEPRDGLES